MPVSLSFALYHSNTANIDMNTKVMIRMRSIFLKNTEGGCSERLVGSEIGMKRKMIVNMYLL